MTSFWAVVVAAIMVFLGIVVWLVFDELEVRRQEREWNEHLARTTARTARQADQPRTFGGIQ